MGVTLLVTFDPCLEVATDGRVELEEEANVRNNDDVTLLPKSLCKHSMVYVEISIRN